MTLALSEYDRHQHFIEGKLQLIPPCADEGVASAVARGFRSIRQILSKGGKYGHLKFADEGNGWYSVYVTDGPLQGRTGLYQDGAASCYFDGRNGKSIEIAMTLT
jgi:hypothetical protein